MADIAQKISLLFEEDESISILKSFSLVNNFWVKGTIKVDFNGVSLNFETAVPKTYPMTQPHVDNVSINFINTDLIGYSHINNDGSVCLHPTKDDNFERKFRSEITLLKKWIHNYFIHNREDDRYTYLIPPIKGSLLTTLYFGENDKKFNVGEYGEFSYVLHAKKKKDINGTTIVYESYFKKSFDNKFLDKWSIDFQKNTKLNNTSRTGLWYYIGEEPILIHERKRKLVDYWNELIKYLPETFLENVYRISRKRNSTFISQSNEIFILLGYKIPSENGYETHWNLLKFPIKTSPFQKKNRRDKVRLKSPEGMKICWGRTVNCNYDRFFGRGRLVDRITNSKILIIGIGALGSNLAEILVRGGVKNLALDDFDDVESGNLCRANYTLKNLNHSKVDSLKYFLVSLSPFINISSRRFKINCIPKKNLELELNKNFDIIFDCSTDTEVTSLLDSINFRGRVFSLGLTNNAKYITCNTGTSITHDTAVLYDTLENEPANYFEGTGCGYPTFNASFNDVGTLLNIAIKKINQTLATSDVADSFYVNNLSNANTQINIIDLKSLYQKELNHYLYFPCQLFGKIEAVLQEHFPKEFGGIFIGYKSEKFQSVVVVDIILPSKFSNRKTEFIRYPNSLNERLDLIFKESDGRLQYLGEFHSHPNSPAIPSFLDITTMNRIAASKKVKTDKPILMIGEMDNNNLKNQEFFISYNSKLYQYE